MKIQLKRSNQVEADGSAKKPTAAQMEYGELAVNYNNSDPAIFLENDNGEIIRIAGAGAIGIPDVPETPADIGADLQAVTDVGSVTTNGATFGSDVKISGIDIGVDDSSGHSITSNGRLTCQISTSRNANFSVYEAYRGSELKTKLTNGAILTLGRRLQSDSDKAENIILRGTDGTATFAKQITAAEGYALAQLPTLP